MSDLPPSPRGITGTGLGVRYQPHLPLIIERADIAIPLGRITALVGPNGSGKSTLLKALARQLAPAAGQVVLDGKDIATMANREFAKKLGILFQENTAPADLSVENLVHHGRYPHRRLFEPVTAEDAAAVEEALQLADLTGLRHRPLMQLSAGQRQLAWIAMALAQGPDYLFLDEPTTFLDLAHQFDVMDLVRRLNREKGRTVVLVVHDLNLAAHYADHLFAMRAGRIVAAGTPVQVLTPQTLRDVFEVEADIIRDEVGRTLHCVPRARAASSAKPS